MASLYVGMLFSSYEELKARIDEYQSQNPLNLTYKYSKTLEANRKRFQTGNLNEALKYFELCFACSDCEKIKGWNKSINNVEIDGVNVRVVATKDGQHLEVKRINEKHNHPTATIGICKPSPGKKHIHTDKEIPRSSPKRKRNKSLPQPDSINLGKQTERWNSLKEHLNVYSDEEFAEVLLNRLEQEEFRIQTSRKVNPVCVSTPCLSGVQLSTMTTSTSHGIKREQGTIQDNELPPVKQEYFSDPHEINDENKKYKPSHSLVSGQQGEEYFSDLHEINDENHKYMHSPVSDQQEINFFSDLHGNNDEKYKHSPISPTLSESEIKPPFITYIDISDSDQDEPSAFQMPEREIKPLHEFSNEIYQYNGNGERSAITLPIIDLGKQYERWKNLKQKLQIGTDEGMAMFLIDHQ